MVEALSLTVQVCCGLWFVVCGLWFLVFGLRFVVCGVRFAWFQLIVWLVTRLQPFSDSVVAIANPAHRSLFTLHRVLSDLGQNRIKSVVLPFVRRMLQLAEPLQCSPT